MYSIFESEIKNLPDYGNHHGDEYARYFNMVAYVRETQLEQFYELSVKEIEERGYYLSISTAHINFLRESEEGEDLIVKTQVDSFSGGVFNVNFGIYSKTRKKLLADGYFVYSLRLVKNDLPDQFPEDFLAKLSI